MFIRLGTGHTGCNLRALGIQKFDYRSVGIWLKQLCVINGTKYLCRISTPLTFCSATSEESSSASKNDQSLRIYLWHRKSFRLHSPGDKSLKIA